jgi:hypothetical protein
VEAPVLVVVEGWELAGQEPAQVVAEQDRAAGELAEARALADRVVLVAEAELEAAVGAALALAAQKWLPESG